MYTMRVIPLFMILASFHCHGFRIRRSGIAGFNDPYALSNAYSDMERRRRRTDYGPLVLGGDDSYFNPNSLSDIDDADGYYMGPPYGGDSDDAPVFFPDYRFKSAYPTYRNLQEDTFPYGDLEEPVYTPQKRMSHTSHAYKRMGTSSMNELRKIFASAEVPEKKLAPVKRREPSIDHSQSVKRQSTVQQTQDLVKKVREILAAAERITKAQAEEEEEENIDENNEEPEIVSDVVTEAVSPDGNTVEKQEEIISETKNGDQIKTVFSEQDTIDNGEDKDADKNGGDDNSAEEEVPEATDSDGREERALSKSKRASSKYDSEGYVSDLEEEVENLRDEVVRLQLLQILEDKENDYLANALKFATLDQLQNDDRLVMREYDDINKATETEELIQQISNGRSLNCSFATYHIA